MKGHEQWQGLFKGSGTECWQYKGVWNDSGTLVRDHGQWQGLEFKRRRGIECLWYKGVCNASGIKGGKENNGIGRVNYSG